ncbi:alpha/beta fold hydrolase [Actinophytocola sp.]|uniref:alpha/beta fold hydrolase n=1 Tax=Actinophytocola sp. TaxID=1872138 RepID=UPI00389A25A0
MRPVETDLALPGGGTLHVYDTGGGRLSVFWHHGTPNLGAPPRPLFDAAERLGIRWVSYDRPGYGGSTPAPGRDMASAGTSVAAVADALGIDRFAVMGHSSGGPHALATAASLPGRVLAVVSVAGLAPLGAPGLDWFAGMARGSAAALRAAAQGRAAAREFHDRAEFDPETFTPADHAAFDGPWGWFSEVVGPAVAAGPAAQVDDDLANVGPWGFDPADVSAPTLLLHGDADRMIPASHSVWLAERIPSAELWLRPGEGHISVLNHAEAALDWLGTRAG